jgi:hypothetical protein
MVIFGVRELPRPKKEGYLYYKLKASGQEHFVDFLNLYETSDEELRGVFVKAIQKVQDDLIANKGAEGHLKKIYQTENMSEWAISLLEKTVKEYFTQ